jgi:hypothetical protein
MGYFGYLDNAFKFLPKTAAESRGSVAVSTTMTPQLAYDFCAYVLTANKAPTKLFGVHKCNPTNPCCPSFGINPASACDEKGDATYEAGCEARPSCVVEEDSCGQVYAATGNCDGECTPRQEGYYVENPIYPRTGVGLHSQNYCYNSTKLAACSAANYFFYSYVDEALCLSYDFCGVSNQCKPKNGFYDGKGYSYGLDKCFKPTQGGMTVPKKTKEECDAVGVGCTPNDVCVSSATFRSSVPCTVFADPFSCNDQAGCELLFFSSLSLSLSLFFRNLV